MPKCFYRPELDVVRFIAFLSVFIHHALPHDSITTAYGVFVAASGFGLCLFFALSAYLITTLLSIEKRDTGTVALSSFYKRRALRIWPLYFAALLLSAAGSYRNHSLSETGVWYLAALVMLANVVTSHVTSVWHLWSISVEEQFYAFWPLLVKRLSVPGLICAAIALICGSNAFLAYYGFFHEGDWLRVWCNTFVQMGSFAAGILLAFRDQTTPIRRRSLLARIAGLVGVPCAWGCAVYFFHCAGEGFPAKGPVSLCLGYALVAASCAWLIDSLQGTQWPSFLTYLGRISYGLYVLHRHVLGVAATVLRPKVGSSLSVCLAFAATCLLAALSYRFFETPFLRLKSRFEVVPSGVTP